MPSLYEDWPPASGLGVTRFIHHVEFQSGYGFGNHDTTRAKNMFYSNEPYHARRFDQRRMFFKWAEG
jgi:hypothetical protein